VSEIVFRTRRRNKQVTLNVTSLIDVLFLLLIFFMLTGTFKRVGELELQLPDSSTATPGEADRTHEVELVVTEDGGLRLDGEVLELRDLKSKLLAVLEQDADARVMIKAEGGVQHGTVVRLLDIVRETGFPGVGIGTHMKETNPNGS
jgi:biopolymer transport protein ExbD